MVQGKNAPTTVQLLIDFEQKIPDITFADDPEKKYHIKEIVECIKPLQVSLVFKKNGVEAEIVDPVTRLILFLDDGRKILATLDVMDNKWIEINILQEPPSGFAQSVKENNDEEMDDF